MGRDIIDMVDTMMFLGTVMLACLTVLVVGITILLILMGCDLAAELWNKIKRK